MKEKFNAERADVFVFNTRSYLIDQIRSGNLDVRIIDILRMGVGYQHLEDNDKLHAFVDGIVYNKLNEEQQHKVKEIWDNWHNYKSAQVNYGQRLQRNLAEVENRIRDLEDMMGDVQDGKDVKVLDASTREEKLSYLNGQRKALRWLIGYHDHI